MQDFKDWARMLAASMLPAPRPVKRLPDRRRTAKTGGVAERGTPSQGVAILSPQSARPAPPPAWRRARPGISRPDTCLHPTHARLLVLQRFHLRRRRRPHRPVKPRPRTPRRLSPSAGQVQIPSPTCLAPSNKEKVFPARIDWAGSSSLKKNIVTDRLWPKPNVAFVVVLISQPNLVAVPSGLSSRRAQSAM